MPLHVQVAVGTPPALDDGAVVSPVAAERIDHAPVAHHRHALLRTAAKRLLHRLERWEGRRLGRQAGRKRDG